LRIEADFLLFGNDLELLDNVGYKNKYSTFVELGYPLFKNQKIMSETYLKAGFAFNSASHLYTNEPDSNFDIVNTRIRTYKNIQILHYNGPVSAIAMWNPRLKIARSQLGVVLF